MKTINVTNIVWDTDGQDQKELGLPESVNIEVPSNDDYYHDYITDRLSDTYGFCVIECCFDEPEDDTTDKIESVLSDCEYIDDAEAALKKIGTVRICDEKIDDGLDDNEDGDEYLMLRSYDVEVDGKDFYVRLYYGNNSCKLGTFDVREN